MLKAERASWDPQSRALSPIQLCPWLLEGTPPPLFSPSKEILFPLVQGSFSLYRPTAWLLEDVKNAWNAPLVGQPSPPPAEHSPDAGSIEKLPGSEGRMKGRISTKCRPATGSKQTPSPMPYPPLLCTGPQTAPVVASCSCPLHTHLPSHQPAVPAGMGHLPFPPLPCLCEAGKVAESGKEVRRPGNCGVRMGEEANC